MKNFKSIIILSIAAAVTFWSCGKPASENTPGGDNNGKEEGPTLIKASLSLPSTVTFNMEQFAEKATDQIEITLSEEAPKMFLADLAVGDAGLYKEASAQLLPESAYTLDATAFMVSKGSKRSNALTVALTGDFSDLTAGTTYVLPLVVTLDAGLEGEFVIDGGNTHFVVLECDALPAATPGINIKSMMGAIATIKDSEVVSMGDNTHTFQIRIYPYSWHQDNEVNYIGSWRGKDKNKSNEDFDGMELRFRGTDGVTSNHGNRQCDLTTNNKGDKMATERWYTLTVTCDGSKTGQNTEIAYRYYLDDVKIAEAAPTKRWGTGSSQRFQVGYTLTGFKFGYNNAKFFFDGLVGEIRMWNKVLTEEEIAATLKTVANPSSTDFYAYWRVDEGSGNVLKDASGHGRDLSFASGVELVWGSAAE